MSSTPSISSRSSEEPGAQLPEAQDGSGLRRSHSEYGVAASGHGTSGSVNSHTSTEAHAPQSRSTSTSSHPFFSRFTADAPSGPSHDPYSSIWDLRAAQSSRHGADESNETSSMNLVSADRKRRLTGPAQDYMRRRPASGSFYIRPPGEPSSQMVWPLSPHRAAAPDQADSIYRRTSTTDLTISPRPSPPPPELLHPRQSSSFTPSFPRWQPDSEASECPICKRQFTWIFRKHHCRKCGRVVCNECSPHRITIPRQFIVHPPDVTRPPPQSYPNRLEIVDLTADPNDSFTNGIPTSPPSIVNPALGGGEKVRLCNPCVPDPQPSPQADGDIRQATIPASSNWSKGDLNEPVLSTTSYLSAFMTDPRHRSWLNERQQALRRASDISNFAPSSNGFPPSQPTDGPSQVPSFSNYVVPRALFNPEFEGQIRPPPYRPSPRETDFGRQQPQGIRRDQTNLPLAHPGAPVPFPASPSEYLYRSINAPASVQGHSRYYSLDTGSRPPPSVPNRPRVRSMLGVDPSMQRFSEQALPTSSRPAPAPRLRLDENDICPVCRHALPPRGADGSETAREAHIMACITARDPTTAGPIGSGQGDTERQPRAPVHMLSFVASEKDCVGEDGNLQECSICMVEYEVGEQLARLECLCKFHKTCIVEWFSRKQECPLHKIA